ncbi:MAG: formate dehydrogenase accessory sulfurtransferase FdhD [Marinobacterium sp.]|nr:formate dehydrogenase accessory sulfurtransferase FdhD [Marinobacterium sp.]
MNPAAFSEAYEKRDGLATVAIERWQDNEHQLTFDHVADEQPVALVYNGISYAVMMATPCQLEAFALGFSLSEGLISDPSELYDTDILHTEDGYEVQLTIANQRMAELRERRRNLAGRTGCGLCGTESLQQAIRPLTPVVGTALPEPSAVEQAISQLLGNQPLQQKTGALHGAAWCNLSGDIKLACEDIGRHNALDKLVGTLFLKHTYLPNGFALISSRASYEMVQKACSAGISTLVAVSAPTALAVRLAAQANLNLIGFARPGRFIIYNRSDQAHGIHR